MNVNLMELYMKKCEWHLCDNDALIRSNSKYCGTKCKNKAAVTRFRKNQKIKAVMYKGGSCELCGYDKSMEALQFHHRDPNEKDFGIGAKGHTLVWENIVKELDKCACLCANCHAEVHAGIVKL